MRVFHLLAVTLGALVGAATLAQAQTYGPGMMYGGRGPQGGYGPGYMMYGYGPGWMMGPGHGPGMMYGNGPYAGGSYRNGYRGQRLCWKETDSARGYGYYAPCQQ